MEIGAVNLANIRPATVIKQENNDSTVVKDVAGSKDSILQSIGEKNNFEIGGVLDITV